MSAPPPLVFTEMADAGLARAAAGGHPARRSTGPRDPDHRPAPRVRPVHGTHHHEEARQPAGPAGLLDRGASVAQAVESLGIGLSTLYAWARRKAAFARKFNEALDWAAPAAMGNANARRQLDKVEARIEEIDEGIENLDLVLASAEQHLARAREREQAEERAAARAEVDELRERRQENARDIDRLLREMNECVLREQELGAAEQSAGRKAGVRIKSLHQVSCVHHGFMARPRRGRAWTRLLVYGAWLRGGRPGSSWR